MSKLTKSLLLLFIVVSTIFNKSWGQNQKLLQPQLTYVFDQDSLAGFQEEAARKSAIDEGFFGPEFKIRIFQLRRAYIKSKYSLWPKVNNSDVPPYVAKTAVVPGCTNEDFEASTDGTITSGSAISGWSLSGGNNNYLASGYNSCNLNGCCLNPPSQSAIFTTPYTDPIIGGQYPIYSVFGTSATNSVLAAAANTQIATPMLGNKIIRINNPVNDYSIEKLSKTFAVTANNALFQFAFISVFFTGHQCCDAGSFRIRLYNASGGNTLIPCPTFSVAAPSAGSSGCAAGPGTPNYYNQASLTPYVPSTSQVVIYNPWQISSIDLTPYIGQNITIEIIVTDCDAGGHYGYIYFDAQCGPMTIYGNGTGYPAGATTATVPTCGAAGATLCAAGGLGPYSWAGPGVNPPYTTPSLSNQCYTTNLSGTYTLYMNPAGSCAPIQRIINATITPAPLLYASAVQATCGHTISVVTVTPSGSAAVPSAITWSPAPQILSTNTLQGTYVIPPGPAPIIVTVTATDPLGCLVVAHATVNPAAPLPTFTITNVSGTSSLTCNQSFVNLVAQTNYTYGTLSYTWTTPSTYSADIDNVAIFSAGVVTVTAMDPMSQCSVTHTYVIGTNTTLPTSALSPTYQTITCALNTIQTVSASATPTINMMHYFYSPQGTTVSVASHTAIYIPGGPGTYTYVLTNQVTGCSITKNFTVATNDAYPTLTVTSVVAGVSSFTVGCSTQSLAVITVSGETSPPGGAVTFTVLPPAPPTTYSTGFIPNYSITIPGVWTAIVKGPSPNYCETRVPFSVTQNTVGPDIAATVPAPILSCNTPSTILTGITGVANGIFSWSFPGTPGTLVSPTIAVYTTTNATSPTIATYTLSIKDPSNLCVSTLTVPMQQNLYPPHAGISGGANYSLTCNTPTINLLNSSTTSIPPATGFPTSSFVIAALWQGPSPQPTVSNSANYTGFTAGIYTVTALDLNNGCTSQATISLVDSKNFPVVNNPVAPADFTIDCGASSTSITPIITGTVTGYTYAWSAPAQAIISGSNTAVLKTNYPGVYSILVTNPASGCSTSGEIHVVNGTLVGDFAPSATSGFAPLNVTFNNTSTSSLGNGSITSVWNYGNGTTSTYTSVTSGGAVYTQPGTYTVTLYTTKGSCTDVDSRVISVDIPSKLDVPNVFTPNGDGINDVYFLKVANMTEITAQIFDRWGHLVYELTSTTGNIAWDGTNQVGTKVAAGVYFYIIKGKGKDDKAYDTKGTITLYR